MKKFFENPEIELVKFESQEAIALNDGSKDWEAGGDDLGWQD